jgi:hypothetical protein
MRFICGGKIFLANSLTLARQKYRSVGLQPSSQQAKLELISHSCMFNIATGTSHKVRQLETMQKNNVENDGIFV